MIDIKEFFKYMKHLSLLYIKADENNTDFKYLLELVSKNSSCCNGEKEAIEFYEEYYKNNKDYYNILIIDDTLNIELCSKILTINPTQKIIINILKNKKIDVSKFQFMGINNFINQPFSMESLSEAIHEITKSQVNNNLLLRYISEFKALKDSDKHSEKDLEKIKLLEEKIKDKSNFLANMSHEIRTPMNAIIGFSDLLMSENNLSNKQTEYVKTINQSAQMLLGLINDILDYSKIEAGALKLEKTSFNLNIILDYISDMIGLKAQEKNLELIFDINHNVRPNFIGDPLRISQIILNLMSNAVKFTDKGSVSIKITTLDTTKDKTHIQFEVTDTGIGLTQKQIENLFEDYAQADHSTSREYGGTGLGLSIAKQLTQLMDGHIWAESVEGVGSTFFVILTLDIIKTEDKRLYRLPSKDIMQKRILLVDSHLKSSDSLIHMLSYFHINVQHAKNIKEAFSFLENEIFDILFIDEDMHKLCDVQDCKQAVMPKVIIIENLLSNSIKIPYLVKKVSGYMKRPFNKQMLFDTLCNLYNDKKNIKHIKKQKYIKSDLTHLKSKEILLVEDSNINQKVLIGLLDGLDINITCAENGKIAIDCLDKKKFDLVFMDIHMPVMNGYEAIEQIRKNQKYDNLAVIAMTGDVTQDDIQKTKEYGFTGHLAKPIVASSFYHCILINIS